MHACYDARFDIFTHPHSTSHTQNSRIPDANGLVEAACKRGLMIVAVIPNPNDGTKMGANSINPTAEALLEVGIHQVYEPPLGSKFDIVECSANLKTVESQQNLRFLGVVPCREAAVDYSDILGALLGLNAVNDLGRASARRDKVRSYDKIKYRLVPCAMR